MAWYMLFQLNFIILEYLEYSLFLLGFENNDRPSDDIQSRNTFIIDIVLLQFLGVLQSSVRQ